jgi:hypothetical protein
MEPRVFVTQLPTRYEGGAWVPTVDITPAREHGEVLYMIPPGFNLPDASLAMQQVQERLKDFTPKDYLLPMGDPIVMAAAAAVLGARRAPFKVLKWDRPARRYMVYVIIP